MTAPIPEDVTGRAEAGDADAQYALAAMLASQKRTEESRLWLERAATGGCADALFTLAAARLSGVGGLDVDLATAIDGLNDAQEKGSDAALRMLAALTAAGRNGAADWPRALQMMRKAIEADDAAAKREIAALLLGRNADDDDGAALLADAVEKDPLAQALIERRRRRGKTTAAGAISLDRAFDRLAAQAERPDRSAISDRPHVGAYRGAIGVDLCDHLIGAALPRLERQEIVDASGTARVHPHRTAMGATLGFGHIDIPSVVAGQLMARLAETPYSHGESLMILRYRPGEEYRPHHDFLGASEPSLENRGQRVRTALLYLNDNYRGGETHFLQPDISFSGRPGDVLVFDNVDEAGEPDVSARHAGRPVQSGEKWLASLWFRDRPYSP
jgi:hypothetical protein